MKYISWSQIGRLKISKSAIFYKTIHKSSMLLLLLSHFSHPTLCDPIDGTPPGSPIPGILQVRTLEWVAISFSKHWNELPFPSPMHENEVAQSCLTLRDPMDCSLPGSSIHGIFQAGVLEWGAIAFSEIQHTSYQLSVEFSSVAQSCPTLCDPWTAVCQASQSITNSQSLLKLMSIGLVMLSKHLIPCCPLFLPPSIFPSIRVFSNESVLCIRWPKYWSFSFSISPSNEYSGLISFRMDCLDLFAVQELSRVFSNTTVQKHQFLGTQSFPCLPPWDLLTHRWNSRLLCPLHWQEGSFPLVPPGKLQLYINLYQL